MLINAQNPEECRAVVLDNNIIQDYIVEQSSREQIKGNIYLGVINRVEPSIEAAFVDFGGKKFGFLPFKDVLKESYIHTGEKKAKVRIQDVLIRGQQILVQVAKESRDAKGPSLTNAMSLAGRFLVLMQGQGSAVSRKIEDEAERKKLKDIVAEFDLPENLGLIIRTAGLGQTKVELHKDIQMLLNIWAKFEEAKKCEPGTAPFLVYQEPGLVVRTVRDHFSSDTSQIIVDSADAYKELKDFIKLVMPRNRNLVKYYKETKPLFSEYHVEEQIESIYNRTVQLPSGGSIVIDIGEAMVSIDVNSGKTKGGLDLEETAVTTNLEAAREISRQLRLRDLGGLVVIDFIDMFQKKNKAAVEKEVKQACKTDKARINIARISKFGLLEMSRQRISPPVKEGVFEKCDRCAGSGLIRSVGSIVLNVLRKIHETIATEKVKVLTLTISPEVSTYFMNHKINVLAEMKTKHLLDFRFNVIPGLAYEDFKYTVSEVWESESIEEPKPPEKVKETIAPRRPSSSRRPSSPRRSRPSSPREGSTNRENLPPREAPTAQEPSSTDKTLVSREPITASETETLAPREMPTPRQILTPDEPMEPSVDGKNGESENKEVGKPKPKRRYTRRKPDTRKPQRGRRRRPSNTAKPEGGTVEVNGNVAESKNEAKPGGLSFPSGDINSPMPPMPMPYVRDSPSEAPASKKPTPPNDGASE